jgi:hypothetical protein
LGEIIDSLAQDPVFQQHNQTVTMPLIDKMATILGLDPSEVSLDGFQVCVDM